MSESILVVDDTPDIRAVTCFHLRRAGYTVTEAATGQQALTLAAQSPDLMVLDVHLPDVDGFEVCRRLRAAPSTAAIPILHLSAAYRGSQYRVKGLEVGADAYLTQPVEPTELLATVRALLRTRRAEVELRETQERFRRLVDTALEGIWSLDAAARTTYVNRQMAAMLGHDVDAMRGTSLYEFMDAPSRTEAEARFERLRRGRAEQHDFRFRRTDGSSLWAIVSAMPVFDDDGDFLGVLALVTDITDRKRAERAERRAETLRSVASLANAAAHELSNPLTVIVTTLQAAARRLDGEPALRARLDRALDATRDIGAILRRMSRITGLDDAEASPPVPALLDLERLVPDEAAERG
jgi:PAS domain S-box-containing protein